MGNATSSSKAGGAPPNNIPSHAPVPPSRDTVVYDGAVREICRLGGTIGLPAYTRPHWSHFSERGW